MLDHMVQTDVTYMTAAYTCLRCGGPLRDDYRYCGRCGSTIYANETVAMAVAEGCCTYCGQYVDSDECTWCPFCGKVILMGRKSVPEVAL